jgi:hypothetical protein
MNNGFIVTDEMRNRKLYDGNSLKFGITVDKYNYIVKHKESSISALYSEHIASRFIRSLKIPCHETWLGFYKKELVTILRDFTSPNISLRSFKDTRQSSEDTDISNKTYTYDDVIYLINKHLKLSKDMKVKMLKHFLGHVYL